MKTCKNCGKEKEKSLFYGVQNECKECTKARVRENSKRVGTLYDFSEKGVFRVIYKTQKRHQLTRGHGDMPYTKGELIKWCKENGFDDLFFAWVKSGHLKDMKPSVDRIDDHKGYSISNITLGTWLDNRNHQYSDIRKGLGTSGAKCKALLKMDERMNVICEYRSYRSAKRDIGYSIERQIKMATKCRGGFYWAYK